jgi:hypothetical protein
MRFAKTFLIGVLIALGAVIAVLIGFYLAFGVQNQEKLALIDSSYIGTIVAGFTSIFAVYLLYQTYVSQKRELRATQEALRLQKIDAAFFQMLMLLQELIRSMSGIFSKEKGGEERLYGREYLKRALEELHETHMREALTNMRPNVRTGLFNPFSPSLEAITGNPKHQGTEIVNDKISSNYVDLRLEVAKMYEAFYWDHQQNLGHYFRYVYNIIKYVLDATNALSDAEIKRYLGILQAQLSNDEMGLIFYNVLSKHGKTSTGEYRFHTWLDNYKILENMDLQSLKTEWHHWFFPKTTFKFLDEVERNRKVDYLNHLPLFKVPD